MLCYYPTRQMAIEHKWEHLKKLLGDMGAAVLAYSGGVDSSVLLRAASEVMGHGIIAVTAASETYPAGELAAAKEFAFSLGVTHKVIHTDELRSEDFCRNPEDRCYFCKRELFGKLRKIADYDCIEHVLDGSNSDDLKDFRPGRKAAGEFSIRSPLIEAGMAKSEIREMARRLNLPVWDKPSLACLASRIPYGIGINPEILSMIGRAEEFVRGLGFRQVRVRHHGNTARIEVERQDIAMMFSKGTSQKIEAALKSLGYTYVCLDLEGYRTGSMNEVRKPNSGVEI